MSDKLHERRPSCVERDVLRSERIELDATIIIITVVMIMIVIEVGPAGQAESFFWGTSAWLVDPGGRSAFLAVGSALCRMARIICGYRRFKVCMRSRDFGTLQDPAAALQANCRRSIALANANSPEPAPPTLSVWTGRASSSRRRHLRHIAGDQTSERLWPLLIVAMGYRRSKEHCRFPRRSHKEDDYPNNFEMWWSSTVHEPRSSLHLFLRRPETAQSPCLSVPSIARVLPR